MFFKKLVVLLAALSLNACLTPEEKAAKEFIDELNDLPDVVYMTDYEACIQFLSATVPVAAKCEGFELVDNFEELLKDDCKVSQCDNTQKNSTDIDLEDCIEYYSTCAGITEDDAPITCYGIMTTCIDTDTDTGSDVDTE